MATPSIANTLLCLFSNDNCILIDDCAPKLVKVVPIKSIWPNLSSYSMDSNLDAAYFLPEHNQVAFFKGDQCAIYNYKTDKWAHKAIKDFFVAPAAVGAKYYSSLTAASTGVREKNIVFYKDHEFIYGDIGDPTVSPVNLDQGPETLENNGWANLKPEQKLVASTLMCRAAAGGAPDTANPVRAMIFQDVDGTYKFTFDDTKNPPPLIPGSFPLTRMWPDYDNNKYPINAATRVDPAVLDHVITPPVLGPGPVVGPGPVTGPNPGPGPVTGPGPVLPHNSLCDELPNIMKSVCSLTVLMHKVVDACYPQSAWPTQPYPDGCSTPGGKHHGCGCKGSGSGTSGTGDTGGTGGSGGTNGNPTLQTGRQYCFNVPANTPFFVTAANQEKWVRTVSVQIDQQPPVTIDVAVGESSVTKAFTSGPGSANAGGKSTVCISATDSQSGGMMLGWYPPVALGDSEFVNIGAEKDYQNETGFNDMTISVNWAAKAPPGAP